MNRIIRHFILAGIAGLFVAVFAQILNTDDAIFIFSMSTAYSGMVLIAATLMLGPLNIMYNRTNPVSSYLRRDVGIWAGLLSIAHVVFGLQRHYGGKFWLYFLEEPVPGQGFAVRLDAFGLTNYIGLFATVACIVLLILSNNASLKALGAVRWKNIQRFNYLFFVLIIGHGLLFQFIIKRPLPYVVIVVSSLVIVIASQWRGYKLRVSHQ